MKKKILSIVLVIAMFFSITPINAYAANNVHNVTQNKWYDTLSAAVAAAANGNTIEVHNSFTETASVKIQKQNLIIRAAAGKNPTISWTTTDTVPVTGATPYHCVVIYTSVTTSTTFGGGTGTLTFDASKASDADNKGHRARVMMHCGKGTLNIKDGIVLTGGNTGGGSYTDGKEFGRFPAWSGEIVGEIGFGSGLFMRYGTLNMSGGLIKDNYSLWGATAEDRQTSHNYYGGGGGVYLYGSTAANEYTTMNMTGGTITHNASGSGGGAGILVGFGSTLNMSGGTISSNVCNFASGGGIGVRTNSRVKINGGLIKDNKVEGHGGGLFARGDSIPLEITGGTFENNEAGGYGGGVLFWTVGDDIAKNTVIIGGDVQIKNNRAARGGGVSVGREVLNGVPIGNKAKLIIQGNPVISGNKATTYGGGIDMQSDEFSTAVNTVEISGGTISSNIAKDGGGIYVPGGIVTMTGGTFSNNEVSGRGAGIFTGGGTMTISNTHFNNNIANGNGGGAFVQGGKIIMNSGSFEENTAKNGGAAYIASGTAEINGGTLKQNSSAADGGAFYVEGKVTMSDGLIEKNEAIGNGGALYITGGDFTMTSGKMIENTAGNSSQLSNGGGAFVKGGSVYIGVLGCEGSSKGENHTVSLTNKPHPIIQSNVASDSGGGIALIGNGNIYMYCGNITNNDATNRGRGWNIYMEKGTFDYYEGDVGALESPELVIVGGTLINNKYNEGNVTLKYYHCNDLNEFKDKHEGDFADKTATVTKKAYFNLPDGEKYWDAPSGYRFFGWTFKGLDSTEKHVRDKKDYLALGEPLEALDQYDTNEEDGTIHMYALWAPEKSNISYVGSIIDGVYEAEELDLTNTNNPTTYNFSYNKYDLTINAPKKPGYTLKGWYIYQSEERNANWGDSFDPKYKAGVDDESKTYENLDFAKFDAVQYLEITNNDGSYALNVDSTNFGDLILIADWEAAYTDFSITKDIVGSFDSDQTFMFQIKGQPSNSNLAYIDMTVTINGEGSLLIDNIPVGTYVVKELTEWSSQYDKDKVTVQKSDGNIINTSEIEVKLTDPNITEAVTFTNTRTDEKWLIGDSYCENWFSNSGIEKR